MATKQLQQILNALQRIHEAAKEPTNRRVLRDPLDMILYENVAYLVSDAQHWGAFDALMSVMESDSARLLTISDSILLRIVKPPGHARMLIGKLREVALIVTQEFDGDIQRILEMSPALAKRNLMKFPGTGEPGAEKILLFSGTSPILALDSNGLRVLLRLGYGKELKSYKATYKSAQEAAMLELGSKLNTEDLIKAHLSLKEHGKTVCRRSKPRCEVCVVSRFCRYYADNVRT